MASDRLDRIERLLHEMTEWTRLNIGPLHDSVSQFLAVSRAQSRVVEGLLEAALRDGEMIRRLAQHGKARE